MVEAERTRYEAEERLNDLFEPDVLLPGQYFAALKRKSFRCGEHRLVVAILQDGVECFQKHIHARDAKRRQLFVDAEAWVSDVDNWDTFSFNNVASMLGINPVYVREGMLAWRDAERTRMRTRILAEAMQEMTVARLPSEAEPEYAPMQATA
ncbi:MAG: hypothetical protein H8E45_07295 [Proteobacteria bacterium]|nr:hypothetical protein [Pseudomonadota bacterium]